jgi:hypothetical protein
MTNIDINQGIFMVLFSKPQWSLTMLGRMRKIRFLAALYVAVWPGISWADSTLMPASPSKQCKEQINTANAFKQRVSDLKEINLKSGVNSVYFKGIDRQGKIITAYMEDIGPASHTDYLVTVQDNLFRDRDDVVSIGNYSTEMISDAPDDGDDWQTSVRFFSGILDGNLQTFLIIANRGPGKRGPTMDATNTNIKIYELLESTMPYFPGFSFQILFDTTSCLKYQNANKAVMEVFGVRQPNSYSQEH